MSEEEIINLWKKGYSVQQILDRNPLAKLLKAQGKDVDFIQNRIEVAILKFQKGE